MISDDQLTAAWDSAEHNARRAERAEADALRLKQAVEDWHDRAVTAERHLESLQNRYAQATIENAVMHQALVNIIDAWDSDDDSMGADPAEIARSDTSALLDFFFSVLDSGHMYTYNRFNG